MTREPNSIFSCLQFHFELTRAAIGAAFNIPLVGAAFANRIYYVISPDGKILYAYSDSNAKKHIENTLAVVRKWREEHKR